jgi:hypothetical protein
MRRSAIRSSVWTARAALAAACAAAASLVAAPEEKTEARGAARADTARPARFPHRIWAACDFEGQTPDYTWFGKKETEDIPKYPGNRTALRGEAVKEWFAHQAGINPVPGPRMGKSNGLYLRYKLEGTDTAQFQHFNLSREDNHHIVVSGLAEGKWAEVALDFTARSRRNDGSPGAMVEGDRMDDLKVFLGKAGDGKPYELLIDDVICFADDPALPPEKEPFPNRVILLAAFDTGEKEKYWPGDFEIVEGAKAPAGAHWRAARAVPRKDGKGKWIRVQIAPPRPVGETTRLRFRAHATGVASLIVQIFDLTAMDNRHVVLRDLADGGWRTVQVDFTRDSRRNDGSDGPFSAGNLVDDLFFFVEPAPGKEADLVIDEVVLYDAGKP